MHVLSYYTGWDHFLWTAEGCLSQNTLYEKHKRFDKVENFKLKNISSLMIAVWDTAPENGSYLLEFSGGSVN